MRVKIILLTALGFLFLVLGALGLVLPVLPTTPFVLVSAACFSCTPRLKAKIMKISFFREYITNYGHKTGLSRKTVVISLCYLWGMLLLSILLVHKLLISLFLILIGIAVTVHILCMARPKSTKKGDIKIETRIRNI